MDNIIILEKNGTQYLQFKKLNEYSDILNHAYSLGQNVSFRTARINSDIPKEELDIAINSYKSLCNCIGVEYNNIAKASQAHTDTIKIIDEKINKDKPDFDYDDNFDGFITDKPNIVLSTTNADCILLLFFDPVKKVIANVHSGWKGTLKRVGVRAVNMMIKKYNCNPKDIICAISPSIRKCHFEVDRDVFEMFDKEFKYDNIITQKGNKWYIDTVLINKLMLEEIGLKKENILDSGICSVCNDLTHSYRKEGKDFKLDTLLVSLK